jgi:arginyl-tRNA synthetase
VEFVSSNPTGPLTIGHGRQAALGDVLSNILREAGFQVTREYYFNDAGRQMDLLGLSCYARYMQEFEPSFEFPEDGYQGEYLIDIAKKAVLEFGDRYTKDGEDARLEAIHVLRKYASGEIVVMIDADLKEMGIVFDSWFNESSLYADGKVDETIEMLKKAGVLYDKDGALWFKASEHGDEEDRVLIKSTGDPTYFMTDIAYHIDKYKRDYHWMINIHGADHHGYVPRMKAAMKALGFKEDGLRYLVHQMVSFIEGGVKMKMSTRAGAFVTLKELMDKVGVDATRYFFVMRKADSHLVFDIDVARKQTDENPVYYVQYVHARIANILAFAENSGLDVSERSLVDGFDPEKIIHDEEWGLIKKLADFPSVLEKSAIHLEPHRLTAYLEEVAAAFHNWYQNQRVVTDDRAVSTSRLLIAVCTRSIIARGLDLLGVNKPDRM